MAQEHVESYRTYTYRACRSTVPGGACTLERRAPSSLPGASMNQGICKLERKDSDSVGGSFDVAIARGLVSFPRILLAGRNVACRFVKDLSIPFFNRSEIGSSLLLRRAGRTSHTSHYQRPRPDSASHRRKTLIIRREGQPERQLCPPMTPTDTTHHGKMPRSTAST